MQALHPDTRETREAIRLAFAKAAFASDWADAIDNYESEVGGDLEMPSLSGCDIFEVAPFDRMPADYLEFAERTIRETEESNRRGIVAIAHQLTETDADDFVEDDDAERFGIYLYHSAVGAGTGLWDEYEKTGGDCVRVPDSCGPYSVGPDNIGDFL